MSISLEGKEPVRKGTFFHIYDIEDKYILLDKTKRGLTPLERSVDEKYGVEADKGIIYDMDGIGHKVVIRWYFSKSRFTLEDVLVRAREMDEMYRKIREETCPD